MRKLVIATGNPGKLKEFQEIFSNSEYELISQNEFNVPEVEETGLSFIENAILKARAAAKYCDHPCLADDSGLCISTLDDRPGIYSARYAGSETSFEHKMQCLINEIEELGEQQPKAFFYCALAIVRHPEDPCPIIATGRWDGSIQHHISGENGFGYDPFFYVPEYQVTAAELDPSLKAEICHRGRAVAKLKQLMQFI